MQSILAAGIAPAVFSSGIAAGILMPVRQRFLGPYGFIYPLTDPSGTFGFVDAEFWNKKINLNKAWMSGDSIDYAINGIKYSKPLSDYVLY